MTRVLVTGANGYIGRALSARLKARVHAHEIESLTLLDLGFDQASTTSTDPRIRCISGDVRDAASLAQASDPAPGVVFHLAGITSRQAEEDFALGLQVNTIGSIGLFERLRVLGHRPVVVCASSIGVYGTPLPGAINDDTPIAPTLSYGAQKRVMEILLADYSRRGWIDARAVRLPGVVARPTAPGGALSAFASDLIREPAEGRKYTCPIGPQGSMWLLSLSACVDDLLHAAEIPADRLPAGRAWNLPALRATAQEVVQALCRRFGPGLAQRVEYHPVAGLQAQFGQWPPLSTDIGDFLGFRHDGDLDTLIERALQA
jgi:nucleoside-diphosphate-sugar epimerase